MTRNRRKDPVDVVATIKKSIEISRRQTRRFKLRRLGDLFGFDRWSRQDKERVSETFSAQEVVLSPSLDQVEADDWVHLTLANKPPAAETTSSERSPDFSAYLESLELDTEKEVELHFVSPLFHHLGYDDHQEAAGYPFDMPLGREIARREADLLYFADGPHDHKAGTPLVLVECKSPSESDNAGLGQVQAYAMWLKPAYYLLSNGRNLQVWRFLGGAIHDTKVFETDRDRLADDLSKLNELVNPGAAALAREQTLERFADAAMKSPRFRIVGDSSEVEVEKG